MENLERNYSYRVMFSFIDILAFEISELCLRVGALLLFLTWGPEFCTEKPGVLTEKIVARRGWQPINSFIPALV